MFRSRLDQIIDMGHPLVRLAGKIDWAFLESRFGEVHEDKPGRPPLATRLMAGLAILKHMHDLSDESLCDRRSEEHTSELQSLMRISYAVFCVKKKNILYDAIY